MIIAQWFTCAKKIRTKPKNGLLKITDYEKQLNKSQHGYYNLLMGLIESRKAPMKSEKYFKKALVIGYENVAQHGVGKIEPGGYSNG